MKKQLVIAAAGILGIALPTAHADDPAPNCVPLQGHSFVNLCRMPDNTLAGCPALMALTVHCQPVTDQNKGQAAPDQVIPPPFDAAPG
jgi:hypothetical protein